MTFASTLGFRYIRAKSGSRYLSLISLFSILGVGIGVATLILVLSVMDGFEHALKTRLAKGEYHILMTPSGKGEHSFFSFSTEDISTAYMIDTRVLSVNPVLKTEAIMRAGKRVSGISIRGISEAHMNSVGKLLVEAIRENAPPTAVKKINAVNGLWVGKELAYQLNIFPGDKVSVISPLETEGPLESVPRIRTFQVEGIYESGIPEKDLHVVYSTQNSVESFLQVQNKYNQVEILTKEFDDSDGIADKIRENFSKNFTVRDWKEMNAHLFASLRLERITMFLILAMIIFVASFNIVTSLTMLVTEKRRDIAILKAMGATESQIGNIFLVQGILIGNIGTFLGFFIGLGICFLLKNYPVIELPDIFYDRSLPVKITIEYIIGIMVTAFLIVLAAAWFPAKSAARLSPLEGFRSS